MFTTAKPGSPTFPDFSMSDVIRPDSAATLAEAIAAATPAGAPLTVRGNATRDGFGRPPPDGATVIDLTAMTGITLYEPEELVLSARAGTPLADIEAALAAANQHLAFEPADLGPVYGKPSGAATLGGTVACNLAGPRRVRAGAVRDHILGITAVSGRGEVFKSGGRVVKNVTGYDMSKLLTGSFGTLAVMTDITIKVLPAPHATATVVVTGAASDSAAVRVMSAALNSAAGVSAAAHLPRAAAARMPGVHGDAPVTLLRLEGAAAALGARRDLLADDLAALATDAAVKIADGALDTPTSAAVWRQTRDVAGLLPAADAALWRISTAPTQAPGVLRRLDDASVEYEAYYDWGGGLIWLAVTGGEDAGAVAIRAALEPAGGHATLIRAAREVRAAVAVFQPQPDGVAALTRRIKDGFDPRAILNPGRMYAGV